MLAEGRTKLIRKKTITKTVLCVAFIAITALMSYLIKETIDSVMPPENSLPIIQGSIGYTTTNIVLAGYEWNYLTRIVRQPTVSPPDLRLIITDVTPDTPIALSFSKQPETLQVSRSDGQYASSFTVLTDEVLMTPSAPNVYTYCVEAGFDRGSIIYYFSVEVKEVV